MPPPDHHHDHHHHLHGGAPPTPPKPNQKVLSLIFKAMIMTVITTLFFLFLGVAAILLLIATAALHRHSTPSSNSSKGLSYEDLKRLPRVRFSNKASPPDQSVCVVCLEEFRQDQWCRILGGCGHVFHRKCVDAWLVKVSACPICRTQVQLGSLVKDRPLWDFGWRNELRVW